ncbi:hypothetical protein PS9374_04462 [Planomonospora sphaerica]|uniref:Uncharacterized protein n=1 Tax=Planomonospora sphaerica TaxID=161355 RepID=A0A171DIT9_9ACTN|nr:hypothetical protein PS9374_04462 [Planomonospora sphaerica]
MRKPHTPARRPEPPTRLWHVALAMLVMGPLTWALGSFLHAQLTDVFVQTRLAGASVPDWESGFANVFDVIRQVGLVTAVAGAMWTIALLPLERARKGGWERV